MHAYRGRDVLRPVEGCQQGDAAHRQHVGLPVLHGDVDAVRPRRRERRLLELAVGRGGDAAVMRARVGRAAAAPQGDDRVGRPPPRGALQRRVQQRPVRPLARRRRAAGSFGHGQGARGSRRHACRACIVQRAESGREVDRTGVSQHEGCGGLRFPSGCDCWLLAITIGHALDCAWRIVAARL